MGTSNTRLAPSGMQGFLNEFPSNRSSSGVRRLACKLDEAALSESAFNSMLKLECQRAERSRKSFVLMLLGVQLENEEAGRILERAADVALATKRETDLV